METKLFPLILAIETGQRFLIKIIYNTEEYNSFCTLHVNPGLELIEIQTLEALSNLMRSIPLPGIHTRLLDNV